MSIKVCDKVHRSISKLGKALQLLRHRVSIRQLLDICQNVAPSTFFPSGGYLFKFWFFAHGKEELRKQCKRLHDRVLGLRSQLWLEVLRSHGPNFFVYAIKAVKDKSNKTTRQLFFLTLMLDWRGLSKHSLSVFGKSNLSLKKNTYLRLLQKFVSDVRRQNEVKVAERPGVWWIDNFSKFYGSAFLGANKDPLIEANFTAVGYSKMPNDVLVTTQLLPNSPGVCFFCTYSKLSRFGFITCATCALDFLLSFSELLVLTNIQIQLKNFVFMYYMRKNVLVLQEKISLLLPKKIYSCTT